MILCIQNLFDTGSSVLFDSNQELLQETNWDTRDKSVNLQEKISGLLTASGKEPADVTEFLAINGPGPFTAVRTISVIAQVWKSQVPQLKLFAIPTEIFLAHKFPAAEHLILPAGRTAFFHFPAAEPEKFRKLPVAELQSLSGKCGGIVHPDWQLPDNFSEKGRSNAEIFQELLSKKAEWETENFEPIYGAEPAINRH